MVASPRFKFQRVTCRHVSGEWFFGLRGSVEFMCDV